MAKALHIQVQVVEMTVVAVNCNDKQVLEVAVMVVVVNYIEPGEVVAMEMVV